MSSAIEALQEWIGRTETAHDEVTASAVQRLSATLDRDEPRPPRGAPLPRGWHSLLFPRVAPRSALGRDGHPRLGDFLPPVPLPRRMFAGRRATFHADLRIGDEVRRTSEIASITPKEGRSGQMVFVTVRHSIESERGLAVVEDQDIVYREEAQPGAAPTAPKPAATHATWMAEHTVDEVTLFRYSALTFNGHRIHYDQPYVTGVEGYRGLVMNGGLTTLLVHELARERAPTPLRHIATRNLSPLFNGDRFAVCAEPEDAGASARLWVANAHGATILEGRCDFE